jgi:NADPH:quinone reductase-like Zn-dependent oxidoreductase
MKAAVITAFGGTDVIQIQDLPTPELKPRDVLVRVLAASINPIDAKFREGALQAFFKVQPPHVMGRDFGGVVLAVGPEVTDLKPGDAVFGSCDIFRHGSHAEQVATDRGLVRRLPAGFSAAEAAAVTLAGLSALALIETAGVNAGSKVLVHAGAGGVGSLAIQMAKARGAYVAATASAANFDYLKSLGADRPIDYRGEDFAAVCRDYNAVLDTMGGETHRRSFGALKHGGVIAYLTAQPIAADPSRPDVEVKRATVIPSEKSMAALGEVLATGKVQAQVQQTLPFARIHDAYAGIATGRTRGKIVITFD